MAYSRLDFLSYEIRLVNIQEAPYDESIHCTLEKTTLLDPGSYYALSYCWGDESNNKRIIVNGLSFEVRHNLEAALRQLRSRGYLRIWIDALCINQHDEEERGLQIRTMRQVYSQAIHVILWLGDDLDNTANAVKYLFENYRYMWFPGRRRTATDSRVTGNGGKSEDEQEWDGQRWRLFQSFFELDYWRRVWVIQEIASSKQVKVLFGHIALDWESITNALDYWKSHSDQVPKACASYEYAAKLDHFRTYLKGSRPLYLFEAIQWSQYALATEQRDKIYALLGLTSDGPRLVPMPNYKWTPEQILSDLVRAMIVAEKSPDVASMKSFNHVPKGWDAELGKSIQLYSELNTALGSSFFSGGFIYSHIPMQPTLNAASRQAQVKILGQICQLSTSPIHNDPNHHMNEPRIEATNKHSPTSVAISSNLEMYPSGFPTAICQTLCLGQSSSGIDPHSCLNRLWSRKGQKQLPNGADLRSWDDINHWFRWNATLLVGSQSLQQWSQLNFKTGGFKYMLGGSGVPFSKENFEGCVKTIDKVLQSQMRLMVTQTGLIGMAPSNAQIGDWVCYLKGLSIPIILRRKEVALYSTIQEHLVIGSAYVYIDEKLPGNGVFEDWAESYFMNPAGLQNIVLV